MDDKEFLRNVVSYRNSTSNHNIESFRSLCHRVVSYRNSTSNHNTGDGFPVSSTLYLIEILHQTTTISSPIVTRLSCILSKFYIKPQPWTVVLFWYFVLYLIEILHQTTTRRNVKRSSRCCILSKFYIKPQQRANR